MAIKIQEGCSLKKIIRGKRKRKSYLTLIKNKTVRSIIEIKAKKRNIVIQ
jgi:hypothetical protein